MKLVHKLRLSSYSTIFTFCIPVKSFLLASNVFVMGPVHSSANANKRSLAHALFSANRNYIEGDRLKLYLTHLEMEHWLKCCYIPFYFVSAYNLMQTVIGDCIITREEQLFL